MELLTHEKPSSRYLRYPLFKAYLAKKRAEGKHYNVAISHAAKKLVKVIYHLQNTGKSYIKAVYPFLKYISFFEHLQKCSVCHAVFNVLISDKVHFCTLSEMIV